MKAEDKANEIILNAPPDYDWCCLEVDRLLGELRHSDTMYYDKYNYLQKVKSIIVDRRYSANTPVIKRVCFTCNVRERVSGERYCKKCLDAM